MSNKVFLSVLNIGWTCTRHDLRSYFSKFGKVHGVNIPMSNTGFNQKIASVKMSGEQGFAEKLAKDFHLIDGNEVHVQIYRENSLYNITEIRKR